MGRIIRGIFQRQENIRYGVIKPPPTNSRRGYEPTSERGRIRKRRGAGAGGNRPIHHSGRKRDQQLARQFSGKRYNERARDRAKNSTKVLRFHDGKVEIGVSGEYEITARTTHTRDQLSKMTKRELIQLADDNGVVVAKSWRKGHLLDELEGKV